MKHHRPARPAALDRARCLSDDSLIDDLRRMGVSLDREGFRAAAGPLASPAELTHELNATLRPRLRGAGLERLRTSVTVLWERWLSERPTFEMIDDWMQAGYRAERRGDEAAAADHWMRAWTAIAAVARQGDFANLEQFDQAFGGTQLVFNWVQDLDDAFHNSGLDEPRFWEQALQIADEVLRLFPNEDQLFTENKRRVIAESHAKLGRRDVSDDLYRQWLAADPAWGWGWIGWADTYFLVVGEEMRDIARAEAIFHEALGVAGIRDRVGILDRLACFYEDTDRNSDAVEIRRRIAELKAVAEEPSTTVFRDPETGAGKVSFKFGEEGLPLERLHELPDRARKVLASTGSVPRQKVGRNEPCPCGSGLKFKKCCGR